MSMRWVFQGNPKRFNTIDAIKDPILQQKGITWLVKDGNGSKMSKEDIVFLYNSGGKKSGSILAKCAITSSVDVRPPDPDVQKYWTALAFEEYDRPFSRVWLKILEISSGFGLPYEEVETIKNIHGKVAGVYGKTNIQLDPESGDHIEKLWKSTDRNVL